MSKLWLRVGIPGALLAVLVLIYLAPSVAAFIYTLVAALAPLWLPPLLVFLAWPLWLTYIRSQYVASIEYATIELKPGDNTPKTAKPMELALYSLYYRTDITWVNSLLKGEVRVPWGLEVAANGGVVKFYLHLPVHHRAAVEARLRAEYRDVDIDQVRDYSREVAFDPLHSRIAMREYTLAKADPYPLRTYESHEHGKERRDVFGELLEQLAGVGDEEHVWISLMIRPHQRDWGRGVWDWLYPQEDELHTAAQVEIQKLVGNDGDLRSLPAGTKETVAAIERALQKPSFDCGLRAVYMAPRTAWREQWADALDTLFERFNDPTLNSFEAYDPRESVGWPLSEVFHTAPALDMEYFLKLYRRRAFFAPPYYGRAFVLNTEELATLWHLPKAGRASALGRSRSTRLEPPENLPV